jgi:hypothetical protein
MAKKTEIISKWSDKIHRATLNNFIDADKTPTKKYLDYLCKTWYNSRSLANASVNKPQNSNNLIKNVLLFDSLLPYIENKDIYSPQYFYYNDLITVVEKAQELKDENEFKREDHIDVIIENDDVILLRPKTYKGSLKYGSGTRWCTASKHSGVTFNNYYRNGWLFYLIRKKPTNSDWDKVAFYIRSSGHGPVVNGVDTYCSKDVQHTSNGILNGDWNLIDLMNFHNLVRSVAVTEWRSRTASKRVKEFKTKLDKLNIDRVLEELVLVQNGVGSEYQELIDGFKQSVEKFQQKITLTE